MRGQGIYDLFQILQVTDQTLSRSQLPFSQLFKPAAQPTCPVQPSGVSPFRKRALKSLGLNPNSVENLLTLMVKALNLKVSLHFDLLIFHIFRTFPLSILLEKCSNREKWSKSYNEAPYNHPLDIMRNIFGAFFHIITHLSISLLPHDHLTLKYMLHNALDNRKSWFVASLDFCSIKKPTLGLGI